MTSKKGACSSNTQPAKANCLAHNRREGHTPSYVNPHLTHLNRTVFEDAAVSGRKSIVPLVKRAEKDYTAKTGQKCQKSFTPFRESCLVVRAGTTDAQLMAFKEKAESLLGWRCLGIWMHLDEGHAKSRYIEGEDGFATNSHAHVLWDCIDHATGKAVRPTRSAFSRMQDLLAESTGMERGNKAKDTGRTRRSASEQRIHSLEQRITQLEQEAAAREQRISQASGKAKEIGAAAIEGLHNLLQPGKAKQERAEEIAAARADERAKVIQEVQKSAGLTLPDATAESIGKSWGSWYSTAAAKTKDLKAAATANQDLKAKADAAKREAEEWRSAWCDMVNERGTAMGKVKEQAEELDAWRSGLLGRAIEAIIRFVRTLLPLKQEEKNDIAIAAAKITPHGLYKLATARLPEGSEKSAERAIILATQGDDGQNKGNNNKNHQTSTEMRPNEQLDKKWAEVLDYATQHAKDDGLRKGLPWIRDAFNQYFEQHEAEVEAGRAMSFGGQSGSLHNREVMAEQIRIELGHHIGGRGIIDEAQEARLKKSLDYIVSEPQQSRGMHR